MALPIFRYTTLLSLLITLILVITGCDHTPQQAIREMDSAEALMEDHPDSSLAILQTIDTLSLHSDADRARRSLLMTMAVDKNYIDTTDFRILRPALAYYIANGTPDQRLKTRYYEGRIWMNQGNDDKALEAFLRASEDSLECTDSLALARLYIAQSSLYYRQYALKNFVQIKYRACNIYCAKKDTLNALECYLHILNAYTLLNDSVKASGVYRRCKSLLPRYPELANQALPLFLTYELSFIAPARLEKILRSYDALDHSDMTPTLKMDIAYAYQEVGNGPKALQYLRSAQKDLENIHLTREEVIKHTSISSYILESNQLPSEALDAYKIYVDSMISKHNYLFQSGVLFSEERHEAELKRFHEESKTLGLVLVLLFIILGGIILFLLLLYLYNKNKGQKNTFRFQRNQRELELINRNLRIETLQYERELTEIKVQQAETEKSALKLKMDLYSEQLINLENEKIHLTKLLNNTKALNKEIRHVLIKRTEVINSYLRANISGNPLYLKEIDNYLSSIKTKKEEFFKFLTRSFGATFPNMINKCREVGLTERELNVFCMLGLGLQNGEIQRYMGLARLNAVTSDIRKKFGIGRKDGTLGSIIRNMMEEENKALS